MVTNSPQGASLVQTAAVVILPPNPATAMETKITVVAIPLQSPPIVTPVVIPLPSPLTGMETPAMVATIRPLTVMATPLPTPQARNPETIGAVMSGTTMVTSATWGTRILLLPSTPSSRPPRLKLSRSSSSSSNSSSVYYFLDTSSSGPSLSFLLGGTAGSRLSFRLPLPSLLPFSFRMLKHDPI